MPVSDATEEVTAAIIMEEGAARLTLEQVREWAEKSIAHYALPRQIVFIAELPRNQMGKILRRKVAQVVRESSGAGRASTAAAYRQLVDRCLRLGNRLAERNS